MISDYVRLLKENRELREQIKELGKKLATAEKLRVAYLKQLYRVG